MQTNSILWVNPGCQAAYPSLSAAQKALKVQGADTDRVTLVGYELSPQEMQKMKRLLTDDEGKISRTTSKRVLDGACAAASTIGAVGVGALTVASVTSLAGFLLFGSSLIEFTGDLLEQGHVRFVEPLRDTAMKPRCQRRTKPVNSSRTSNPFSSKPWCTWAELESFGPRRPGAR